MVKSITIGVLSPVTGGFYYGKIVAGIAREVDAVGGRVVLIQTLDAGLGSDDVVSAPDFRTATAWDHLDGVISIASATRRNYLRRLENAGKAIALASDEIDGFDAPSATPDNTAGVTEAVNHLVAHGHTRIGYAANLIQPDMRERHDAYRAAMLAHGIDPHQKWFFAAFDNGELGGRDVAHQFVAAGMPISALLLATDRNAIGCMAQLADLGVRVPDDLAVVGFDGLEAGAYSRPTLSTVFQPYDEIGASAARLVLAQLRGDEVEPRAYQSSSKFLARGSCGCSGGDALPDADGGIAYWRNEAEMRFARSSLRENSMREQYQISMQLLDHERADPRELQWLEATNVRGAYLALWEGEPSTGRLRIAGMHDPDGVLPILTGTICTVEQFPPASLIALADPHANEVSIVVPVKGRGHDFGLLAVAGEVDSVSHNGRETHNQWAALLTAALEQQNLGELRERLEERLRQSALYDEVTGLPNRRLFLERLSFAISDVRRPSELLYAVVFLDLDSFKLVNDSLGHLEGDHLLTQIGQRLRSGLRPADLAARFGGDEFAVLLHNIDPSAIQPIVQRMQADLAAPMDLDGHEVVVTASVGIATSTGDYTNAEDVLRDADIAMYHAKSHHSGSFAMFDVAMHASAVASMGLQSDLRQAMDRKQFEVHYQPIVGLDAKEIDRFEALVRWRHPRRGIVAPMDFLPDLEEIGLIVALGRWVIEEVCRQIAVWQSSYDGLVSVSVNLSLREFSDARLVPHIVGCLHRYGLVPANLTLEVTESVIMRNPEAAQLFIEELHSVGIGVQIDDVGTSTSSLHALRCFPIQALKIDHSFIHDLDIDPRATMLVQFMIAMGQALGLDVVAEGVETMVQLQRLRAMGCNNAQGFLFAKAVDAGAAAQLLGQSLQVLAREPPLVAEVTSTDAAS